MLYVLIINFGLRTWIFIVSWDTNREWVRDTDLLVPCKTISVVCNYRIWCCSPFPHYIYIWYICITIYIIICITFIHIICRHFTHTHTHSLTLFYLFCCTDMKYYCYYDLFDVKLFGVRKFVIWSGCGSNLLSLCVKVVIEVD